MPKATARDLALRLYDAAAHGDAEQVRDLLAAGARPDGRPSGEPTPLIAAASRGHGEVVRILIAAGADPSFRHGGKEGTTALLEALEGKHVAVARILVAAGADVNFFSSADYTGQPNSAVTEAVRLCNRIYSERAGLPLEQLAGSSRALTPEQAAAVDARHAECVDLVREMLAAGGTVYPGMLADAAMYGNVALLRLLLEHGADVNAPGRDETAFASAVEYNQVEVVEELLRAGADPYAARSVSEPPLHRAVAQGRVEIVQAAVQAGVDLDRRGTIRVPKSVDDGTPAQNLDEFLSQPFLRDVTPLIVAARCGLTEIVRLLAAAGADLEAADHDGFTALAWALQLGHAEMAAVLREAGAREPESLHGSPFHRLVTAAERGDLAGVREAVAAGADLDGFQVNGLVHLTPLMLAARGGHTAVVRELLAAGADPARAGREDWTYVGLTPLMLAARAGDADSVELLLHAGADPHARVVDLFARKRERERGDTALHEAARGGHAGAIRALLRHGADPRYRSSSGTALTLASASGSREAMEALLSAGAKPGEAPRDDTGSPLSAAAGAGDLDAARRLISAGANPNAASPDGTTALYYAVLGGRAEVVRLLLDAGADPNASERPLMTPLASAAFNGQDEIVRILLAAGAEASARNHDGSTPLHAAVAKGRPEMIELLLQAGADPTIPDEERHTPLSTALDLVKNCIEEVPPAWHALGFPLEGEEADAIRRIVTMLKGCGGVLGRE